MNPQWRMMTVAGAALAAAVSFAMTTQSASAQEWCLGGATVGANYCEYYTQEQCQAAAANHAGMCTRNPFAAQTAQTKQPGQPSEAYAKYVPAPKHQKVKKAIH